MFRRLSTIWLLPALFAFIPTVTAKPPELPINEKVVCEEPQKASRKDQTPVPITAELVIELLKYEYQYGPIQNLPGVVPVFGIEVLEFDWLHPTWVKPTPLVEDMAPRVRGWFQQCATEVFDFLATEQAPTCPYLRVNEGVKKGVEPEPTQLADSVLENLSKLELAQKVYQAAEECRRDGGGQAAEKAYRMVQELCPGSRWGHLASERLNELRTARAETGSPADAMHAEESAIEESPTRDWQRILRGVAEKLQEAADIEVDLSAHAIRRLQCEVHVGGTMYKVVVDENGNVHWSRQALTP
jgi:hypothetical protein